MDIEVNFTKFSHFHLKTFPRDLYMSYVFQGNANK